MKKILSILLVLCLLASACALADEGLYQKLYYQVQNGSSIQAEIDFQGKDKLPQILDKGKAKEFFETLKANLIFQSTTHGSQKGRNQLKIELKKNDVAMASFNFFSDGALERLETSLITKPIVLAKGEFSQGVLHSKTEWPDIKGLLFSVLTKNFAYQTQLEKLLEPYKNHVKNWLGSHTELKSGGSFDISFSKEQIIEEAKALLDMLYSDSALLNLLSDAASLDEANAYLSANMKPVILGAVEKMILESELKISRSFNKDGSLKGSVLSLPFAENMPYKSLTISSETTEDGDEKSFVLEGRDKTLALSYKGKSVSSENGATELSYSGSFSEKQGEKESTLPFSLSLKLSENKKDNISGLLSQELRLELKLFYGLENETLIKANIDFSSEESKRKPTNFKGDITLSDAVGSLTLKLSGKTASPFAIPNVSDENAMKLNEIGSSQKAESYAQIRDSLLKGLSNLIFGEDTNK